MSPRFPSLTPKKIIKILEHNGFSLDHTSGSHYVFYNAASGRRIVIPYHSKDLPRGTLMAIVKQSGLSIALFQS